MGVLAEWVVQISAKGAEAAKGAITGIGGALEKVQTFAKVAFASMSVGLLGIVKAGLQGTEEGARMAAAWEKLSQKIAAVFLPVVEKVTEVIERLADWFDSLSEEQQDNVMKWTLWIGGVLAAIIIIPKLVAGLALVKAALMAIYANPVILGIGLLVLALLEVKGLLEDIANTDVSGALSRFGGSSKTAASFATKGIDLRTDAAKAEDEAAGGGPGSGRRDVTQKAKSGKTSIEAGDAVYKRIMEAAAGGGIDKQQLKAQQGIWSEIIKLKDAVMRTQPAVA